MASDNSPDFTDDSIMPFGMHKGKAMVNVPGPYLLYLYNEGITHEKVRRYIEANLDVIKKQSGYPKHKK